jgi:inosine-uridine nucleoside N-ribohydrolase
MPELSAILVQSREPGAGVSALMVKGRIRLTAGGRAMLDVVWDMETQDPDDFLTLLLLLGHPDVNLKAVTVTPGSAQQIGVVRAALGWFGRELPVGAHNLDHPKACVSGWHHAAYGEMPPSRQADPAAEVLLRHCDATTTLITGGPLKNAGAALRLDAERGGNLFQVGRLVAQGGFAGEGVVPPHRQLEKFKGLTTCPTYNLNGDPRSALAVLQFPGIGVRRFVSKNVCHGVVYDQEMHRRFAAAKHRSLALELIWKGMDVYLAKQPGGKKFHDPLAACCAIDESIGTWAEVEIYREKGQWGSRLASGTRTWIITDHDQEKFVRTLLRC